jgi:hypothetical protein
MPPPPAPYDRQVYGSDFLFHVLKRGALATMIGVTWLMEEYTQFHSNLHTFIQKLVGDLIYSFFLISGRDILSISFTCIHGIITLYFYFYFLES